LDKRLTLVIAPTGFGKCTLVRLWIAGLGLPSAWVTLDENDNDPAIGKTALAALMAIKPASFEVNRHGGSE